METADEESGRSIRRRCDFCGESTALLYCRADVARLCLACDRHVHAANTVSSKHPRAPLCDGCCSKPSSFLCSSHNLLLCHDCDFEAHPDGNNGHHDRRPVEPFSGCPNSGDLLALLGVGEDEKKAAAAVDDWWFDGGGGGDGGLLEDEGWVWETPPVLSLDDLIIPTSSCHGFQAIGVPPLPKRSRNMTCGKHKEEILQQIRNMAASEECLSNDFTKFEEIVEFQVPVPHHGLHQENVGSGIERDKSSFVVPICESSSLSLYNEHSEASVPVSFLDEHLLQSSFETKSTFVEGPTLIQGSRCHDSIGLIEHGHSLSGVNVPLLPSRVGLELSGQDRDSVISRYKEKRKTRRYEKHIRYESRKARADNRTRIKGRFARVNGDAQS